jgi:hypothetical protein
VLVARAASRTLRPGMMNMIVVSVRGECGETPYISLQWWNG